MLQEDMGLWWASDIAYKAPLKAEIWNRGKIKKETLALRHMADVVQ